MNAFKSGMKFEQRVRNTFKRHGFSVRDLTGGSKKGPDVSILFRGSEVNFECKTKNSFEGGGRRFCVRNNILVLEDSLFESFLGVHIPWGGRIPAFKLGDGSFDVWMNEKNHFKDEYILIPRDAVSMYYSSNMIHYIIVENKGIYHTGSDPMMIGCPLFTCMCRLRIRCKRHSSSSMPSSVQASLIFKLETRVTHS